MAIDAGIKMAECQVRKFSSHHHTFLTRRFDRTIAGERIHYSSAMTMLGYIDGQDHNDGASYLELVEFITTHGASVDANLEQLWRRIVFSICVSNTDDHLRNHAFFKKAGADEYELTPGYDIVPNTGLQGSHAIALGEFGSTPSRDNLEAARHRMGLGEKRARDIADEVLAVTADWQEKLGAAGVSDSDLGILERCFAYRSVLESFVSAT